jgi:succinyl-CoA synthetase alpha subunit
MSIFLNKDSKVIVQGITGGEGTKHTARMLAAGTNIVGGVNARKAGTTVTHTDASGAQVELPVFATVAEAIEQTGADVSVAFVPPAFTKDAAIEAIDAGIGLLVIITEGVPVKDSAELWAHAKATGGKTRIIGPNCPGIITPGEALAGITPATITGKGPIGLVSKSGTLTYQMMYELRDLGFSTAIGIGGDPVIGTTHIDALAAFEADPETKAIVMIGEIGGLHQGERHQAGRRLRGGLHRPRGQDHGPRRRDRVGLGGHRPGQEGGPRGRRRQGGQDPHRDRRAAARGILEAVNTPAFQRMPRCRHCGRHS